MPLAQITAGRPSPPAIVRRSSDRKCCAGTGEQHRVAARPPRAGSAVTPMRASSVCPAGTRGVARRVDLPARSDRAPAAPPAGARGRVRQRGAPGAGADDPDRSIIMALCSSAVVGPTPVPVPGAGGGGSPASGGASGQSSGQRGAGRIERVGQAERQPLGARPGDHRGIVGAQLRRRRDQQRAAPPASRRPAGARIAWLAATPPATTSALGLPMPAWNCARPARSRSTITSPTAAWNEAQRSRTSSSRSGCDLLGLPHRRLQPGEREVHAGRPTIGRGRAKRVALPLPPPSRPAGRRDSRAQQLGRLVEGLADRVVDRGAEPHDRGRRPRTATIWLWPPETRSSNRGTAVALVSRAVSACAFEMVDRDQRLLVPAAIALAVISRRSRRRSGPARRRPPTPSRSREAHAGLRHRLGDHAMSSASTWARAAISGTTPPKAAMLVELREHDVGQNPCPPSAVDHRRRRLVATRLDAEHNHPNALANRQAHSSVAGRWWPHFKNMPSSLVYRSLRSLPLPPEEGLG